MNEARYRRHGDVFWRLAHDRVVARRIGMEGSDLQGAAALVWVVLDEPRSLTEIVAELMAADHHLDQADVATAIEQLTGASLISATEPALAESSLTESAG